MSTQQQKGVIMSDKELNELHELGELWATGRATMRQMTRHMELSRKRENELKQHKEQS